jgi:branched-chain amino acid transport system permease protein
MLTLAAAQILWSAGTQWQDVTGGDDGLIGIWPAAWASGTTAFYYLTLILCGIGISALFSLGGHRFGMLLRAGRDAPARAEALGINVRRRQWAAIIIAGTSAGLAGGIFAFSKGSVFPDTLSIPRSVDALVMVLLGGLHAPAGSILGAGVFTLLDDLLSRLPYWRALLGLAVVAIAMFAPGGIGGAWAQFIRRKKAASA